MVEPVKPMSIKDIREMLDEQESRWTEQDDQYLGKFEDQSLLIWLPKQGFAPAIMECILEWGGFLVTGVDADGNMLL